MAYTQAHTPAVLSSHKSRTIHNSAAFLLPHLRPTDHVLDIGCGPGTITAGFAETCPRGRVVGIDQAQSVIDDASTSHPPSTYPSLSFQTGDVLSGLPFPDESFDVIFTSQTIIHVPDPVRAMREAHRLLKPNGILAMREADAAAWYPRLPGLEFQLRALDAMVRSSGAPGFGECRALHAWARQAGFDRNRMKLGGDVLVYASPAERKWWAEGFIGRLNPDEQSGKTIRGLTVAWPPAEGETSMQEKVVGEEGIELMRRDLKRWMEDEDGWFSTYQVEVLCWK